MLFDELIVLGNTAFAETGRPTGVYWDANADRLAVASSFNDLQWHGRDLRAGRAFSYRVSVYDVQTVHRLAVFDRAYFSINDVAFHPHEPLIAVASGSYDGGFFYEGALHIWNLGEWGGGVCPGREP